MIIFVCKSKPGRGGGGLGVAYNFLACLHKMHAKFKQAFVLLIGEHQFTSDEFYSNPSFDEFLNSFTTDEKPGASTFLNQASKIRRIASEHDHSIVLAFTPFYVWPLLRIAASANITFIHSEHSKGGRHFELAQEKSGFGLKERLVQAAVWCNFLFSDIAVFPSQGSVSLFCEMNPRLSKRVEKTSHVVHNGVELDTNDYTCNNSASNQFEILSIAHHVQEKGLADVITTLSSPILKNYDWFFTNYGSTSALTNELDSLVSRLDIRDRVCFSGLKPQADVRSHLNKAKVFLHLPIIVVFDLSLLEAMMSGIPIITNPLPGNVEALGEDYPLYASSPDDAAEKIDWIIKHPMEAKAIGQSLRERAIGYFTRESMTERYLNFLVETL